MHRRSFLRFLGAAPLAGVATVAGCSAPALASGGVVPLRRKHLVGEVPSEQVVRLNLKVDTSDVQRMAAEVERCIRSYEVRRIRA